MIPKQLIFFLPLFFALNCFSQKEDFLLLKTIKGDVQDFTVDNLGNIFIIGKTGQIKKLNPNGDSLAVYNDVRRFGKLHSIDVSNPLKVLLFFRSFGTVVVLDRLMNLRANIDLRRQGMFQVKAIGQAYDNNIWVFDEQEARLKRIADDGKLVDQSADFRMAFDSMPSPQYIIDHNRNLYLYDSLKGVYIFDYFGAFKNRVMLTGWTDFTVINNVIFGRKEMQLFRYETGSLNLRSFKLPLSMKNAKRVVITNGILYLLTEPGIEMYSFNPGMQ